MEPNSKSDAFQQMRVLKDCLTNPWRLDWWGIRSTFVGCFKSIIPPFPPSSQGSSFLLILTRLDFPDLWLEFFLLLLLFSYNGGMGFHKDNPYGSSKNWVKRMLNGLVFGTIGWCQILGKLSTCTYPHRKIKTRVLLFVHLSPALKSLFSLSFSRFCWIFW